MIHINKKNTITTRVYSRGTSEGLIEMAKKTLLFDALREYTTLVSDHRAYPKGEMQDIELKADFVILTKDEYLNLLP